MKLKTKVWTNIALTLFVGATTAAAEIALTTLASFNGTNGANPLMLIQTADGSLVGAANTGGIGFNGSYGGNGVIFRLTLGGALSNLVKFDGGPTAPAFMLRAADQNYYGTLAFPPGALFKLNPDGSLANFDPVSFGGTNGENPAWLVEDPMGNLYGVAQFGGLNSMSGLGFGTIFRIDTNSVFSTVARFSGTNGSSPVSLMLGADGNFYGVTLEGGTDDQGTVFKMTPEGTLNMQFSFHGTDGAMPQLLLQGADGYLYGTTGAGGLGYGTVFKMTTTGTLLWSFMFNGTSGSQPFVLMQGADGNLYGTTSWGGVEFNGSWFSGYGTVFRITPEGDFASLLAFDRMNGWQPFVLLTGSDGNLYGTTWAGGEYDQGTIFRLAVPMAPVFQAPFQTNGTVVLKWNAVAGYDYQVQFNADLTSTNWINLGDSILATNGVMTATDPMGPDRQRAYRVALLPQP